VFKPAPQQIELVVNNQAGHIPKTSDEPNVAANTRQSTPPESVFIKLGPSRDRYSMKYEGEL
jgi:hypothetical protein